MDVHECIPDILIDAHPTEVPVFPTVTAIVTMEQYKASDTQHSMFLVPRDYTKVIFTNSFECNAK